MGGCVTRKVTLRALARLPLVGLPLLLLTGCIFVDVQTPKPVSEPIGAVYLSLTEASPELLTDDQLSQLRSLFTSSLSRSKIALAMSENATTRLEGVVTEYKPGNRALRWLFSFVGAGVGRFQSDWSVKNAAGNEIGTCKIGGTIRAGGFGGSYNELLERVGQRLEQCLHGKAK